jgi:nitrate reductase NapAB chaperone NapD
MPVSGLILSCRREKVHLVEKAVSRLRYSTVRLCEGGAVFVVSDTQTVAQGRQEIAALAALPWVLTSQVVYPPSDEDFSASGGRGSREASQFGETGETTSHNDNEHAHVRFPAAVSKEI